MDWTLTPDRDLVRVAASSQETGRRAESRASEHLLRFVSMTGKALQIVSNSIIHSLIPMRPLDPP